MTAEVEIKNWGGVHKGQVNLQNHKSSPRLNLFNGQFGTTFNHISKPMGENVSSEILAENDFQYAFRGESFPEKNLTQSDCCSKVLNTNMHDQRYGDKVG